MKTDQEIADFQTTLMESLYNCDDPQKMLEQLQTDPKLAPFFDYLATFDLSMVEVASELVKKWGQQQSEMISKS